MYTIAPKTLFGFIDDPSVKLPRFQRKATWNNTKKFELALSIFKYYPLGATILSVEGENKFLLDGRQRRDALKQIYENPENLYLWGSKYFHIKKGMSAQEIRESFDNGVSEFIETDEERQEEVAEQDQEFEASIPESLNSLDSKAFEEGADRLALLKELIVFCAMEKKSGSLGITASFDFRKLFGDDRRYVKDFCNGEERVSGKHLRDVLRVYMDRYPREWGNADSFIAYMLDTYNVNAGKEGKFRETIEEQWENRQLKVLKMFDGINRLFKDRTIGLIEVSNITATDSQKIFNLINTGGTKLTSSEILSAKPKWNVPVTVGPKLQRSIDRLYQHLDLDGASSTKRVKWDVPAALTFFLERDEVEKPGLNYFFRFEKDTDIAKRITTGFQLVSGFFTDGVKKENIAAFSDYAKFWENPDDNCNLLDQFFKQLSKNPYLQRLDSWGKTLSDVVGDGPTLNFLFLMFRSYKELQCPGGYICQDTLLFNKNIFILLDRIIYEYQTSQWKGSSDSLIAKNIAAFERNEGRGSNKLFIPLPEDAWKSLLNEASEKNSVNGKPIEEGTLAPLVYYYALLSNKKGRGREDPAEIDHIMPKGLWASSTMPGKNSILNNYFNLSLLPKSINATKNNNNLSSMRSGKTHIVEDDIAAYEDVALEDFARFSDLDSHVDLKKMRENLYFIAFTSTRKSILENS